MAKKDNKNSTIFIIGAGAGVPYGFPTGDQLIHKISSSFLSIYETTIVRYDTPTSGKVKLDEAQKFVTALSNSRDKSIDAFLETSFTFSKVGKEAILLTLLNYERQYDKQKIKRDTSNDWIYWINQYILEFCKGNKGFEKYNAEPNISFLTFNYYRLLEAILFESLTNKYSPYSKEVEQVLRKLQIYHVYGTLGNLPWQDMRNILQFGESLTNRYADLETYTRNLKLIQEREKDEEHEKLVNEIISKAKRIFFLGFGYSEENLEILNIPKNFTIDQKIYGTAYELLPEEIKRIKRKLTPPILRVSESEKPLFDVRIEPCDCVTLLRKYLWEQSII